MSSKKNMASSEVKGVKLSIMPEFYFRMFKDFDGGACGRVCDRPQRLDQICQTEKIVLRNVRFQR